MQIAVIEKRSRPVNATISTRGKGEAIFTNTNPRTLNSVETGATPGAGTFSCIDCGSHLSLLEEDVLPRCPDCGGSSFGRDSIFQSMQDRGATSEFEASPPGEAPEWLRAAREALAPGSRALVAHEVDGTTQVFPIEQGWTRVGRSAVADVRLDDPSVSRRHALIVSELPDALRVLDDRSLNGVHLNGELVEWARLADGDELAIGRYRLFVLEA